MPLHAHPINRVKSQIHSENLYSAPIRGKPSSSSAEKKFWSLCRKCRIPG